MAATIARAIGRSNGVEREATRLGHQSAEAQANTFKTFATAKVQKDGSGSVTVEREIEGKRVSLGKIEFGPENVESKGMVIGSGFDMATNGGQF